VRAVPRDTALGPPGGVAARLPRVPLARALALVALAVAIAVGVMALAAGGTDERPVPGAAVTLDGVSLQSANCTRWWAAGAAERTAAIQALSRSIGGPTPYGPGTTLPDGRVHALFDRVCAPTFARNFLLYEIYIRAAGFKSLGG
jgi:hypothetical protein